MSTETANDTAFIICQLGERSSPQRKRSDEVLEHVIEPICAKHGLAVRRSDKDPTPGQITSQIIKGLIAARVVIVDLTGMNPNVYFELGVAQAFAKPLVMLVKSVDQLPFDVKNERTIVVGDGEILGASDAKLASEALDASLSVVLAEGYEPSNLVTEVASARSLDALAPDNPIASELSSIKDSVEEVHALLRSLRRSGTRDTGIPDFQSLTQFVEEMVEDDRFYPREIEGLVTNETSAAFDKWAARLATKAGEIERNKRPADPVYGDDEPF